jgi:hypothetical protein
MVAERAGPPLRFVDLADDATVETPARAHLDAGARRQAAKRALPSRVLLYYRWRK